MRCMKLNETKIFKTEPLFDRKVHPICNARLSLNIKNVRR